MRERVAAIDEVLDEWEVELWTETSFGDDWAVGAFSELDQADWDELASLIEHRSADWQEKLTRSLHYGARGDSAVPLLELLVLRAASDEVAALADDALEDVLEYLEDPPHPASDQPSYEGPVPELEDVLDEFLGNWVFGELRLWPSERSGYSQCIATSKPPAGEHAGLHVSLDEERAMFSDGMAWNVYEGGAWWTGHAWDDNQPDSPRHPFPFTVWLHRQLSSLVRNRSQVWLRENVPRAGEFERAREALERMSDPLDYALSQPEPGDLSKDTLLFAAACHAVLQNPDESLELLERAGPWMDPADHREHSVFASCRQVLPGVIDDYNWIASSLRPVAARLTTASGWRELLDDVDRLGGNALDVLAPIAEEVCTEAGPALTAGEFFMEHARPSVAATLYEAADRAFPNQRSIRTALKEALEASGESERAAAIIIPPLVDTPEVVKKRGEMEDILRERRYRTPNAGDLRALQKARALEAELNEHWQTADVIPVEQAEKEGRFSLVAAAEVARWQRDLSDWEAAFRWIEAQLADLRMLQHCMRSDPVWTSDFLERAFGCYVDCRQQNRWEEGTRELERVLKLPKLPDTSGLYWNGACLYALTGDVQKGINLVKLAIEHGAKPAQLRRDSDLDALKAHYEFRRLVLDSD